MGNPFTPSFGRVPAIMAGREFLLDELADAFNNFPNDPNLTTILVGARGTGKTAMLVSLAERAEAQGWISVRVTSIKGLLEDIYEQVLRKASHLLERIERGRLAGISIAPIGGVEFHETPKDERNWRSRMTDVLEELNGKGIGLLIEVDEIDPDLPEMTELAAVYQHFVSENRKVSLFMAGLPTKVTALLNGRSVSFLRRASRQRLGLIQDYEVRAALQGTAESGGKCFDKDSLETAVKAVDGFPYMLQLVGYRAWAAAEITGKNRIADADVASGVAIAKHDLEEHVIKATIAELSDADVEYLVAMTPDEGYSLTADITARLGRTSGYVSTYRRRLLEQGVIEEVSRGKVRYALPGLREYLIESFGEE